jgi:hypothetical protein
LKGHTVAAIDNPEHDIVTQPLELQNSYDEKFREVTYMVTDYQADIKPLVSNSALRQ